jgi:HEPN domain-containing protein/predicted nucleotidyltransferase
MMARQVAEGAAEQAPDVTDVVARMVKRVVRVAQPLQVILFGSQARGDTHRWSDVDVLVVIPNMADKQRVWDKIRAALRGSDAPYDVVVSTADEVRRHGNLVGMVLRPALREGKVLYDATATTKWDPTGRPVTLEVDPVTDEDRLAQTRLWLRQAWSDLAVADMVLANGEMDPDPACYHAQQAAEKALKAVLVFLQVQYAFTHDLDAIREDIPSGWDVRREFRNLKKLSEWAFKARYPGPWKPPTAVEAQAATRLARAIYEAVLSDLEAHGFDAQTLR